MNDMRHLYGMPKSAAAQQDEFKQNLRGFFQMQKEAALGKIAGGGGSAQALLNAERRRRLAAQRRAKMKAQAQAQADKQRMDEYNKKVVSEPKPPVSGPEAVAQTRIERVNNAVNNAANTAYSAAVTDSGLGDNWMPNNYGNNIDLNNIVNSTSGDSGVVSRENAFLSSVKGTNPNKATALENARRAPERERLGMIPGTPGYARATPRENALREAGRKKLGLINNQPATGGLIINQSATGGKYDYNEVFGKQASIRNWDLVHYMLKSAAEAASKCPKCGEKKGQCKCGACKTSAGSKQSIKKVGNPIGNYMKRLNDEMNSQP